MANGENAAGERGYPRVSHPLLSQGNPEGWLFNPLSKSAESYSGERIQSAIVALRSGSRLGVEASASQVLALYAEASVAASVSWKAPIAPIQPCR